ncbi:hypothetical protein Tco_0510412 [Tanacetum coccineum]
MRFLPPPLMCGIVLHGIFYPTCRAACEALSLLGDDNEWDIAMQESLQHFGLGPPPPGLLDMLANRLLMEERNYKQKELQQEKNESIPKLNEA